MKYEVISADCHIDLIWLPPDLFTANATSAMKDRMPYVTDSDKGPIWVRPWRRAIWPAKRHGVGRARICPGANPSFGSDG